MFSGGGVTDRLVGIVGLRWGRVLPITISRFVAMTAYIVCLFNPGPVLAVVMFACVAFFTGIDQFIFFPDFDLGGRTADNVVYFDNVRLTDGT